MNVDVPITTTSASFGSWIQLSSVQYQSLPLSLLDSETSARTVPVVGKYLAGMDDTSIYKCSIKTTKQISARNQWQLFILHLCYILNNFYQIHTLWWILEQWLDVPPGGDVHIFPPRLKYLRSNLFLNLYIIFYISLFSLQKMISLSNSILMCFE